MFDLSVPELAVIAVVALLVLGPTRLPGAARTAGALVRRMQRSWSGLRADIERELAADELKREIARTRDDLDVDGEVVRDPIGAAGGLRSHLQERPAGLVAVTTHARSGLQRALLGATAASIVHASVAPCLVAPVRP